MAGLENVDFDFGSGGGSGGGGGAPNPDPGTLQDGEMVRFNQSTGEMEGSGDINTDAQVDFGTKTVVSGTGTFKLRDAHSMGSGGENVTFTNLVDGEQFNPIWISQETNEATSRQTVGEFTEFTQEPSKADILIDPSWTSNPQVDWRVTQLTFEVDTTITNVIFLVQKDGKDFYRVNIGTLTANVETTADLTIDDRVPVDAFASEGYTVSLSSADGDVRAKGSTVNALPFFIVGYFAFEDNIIDPDLRTQRRTGIAGDITQQGYQASVADGSIEDQGWTNESTGTAIIASIIDPDDGLRTLRIFDNSNTSLAAMTRPQSAADFQRLFDGGGQFSLLVRPVTGENDTSMVEGLGFSAANDPGWKGADGRWSITSGVNFNGHPIITFGNSIGTVFTGQIGDYFNCVIVIKPGTMVSDCYINGTFIETFDFSTLTSPATFDDKFRMESGSTTGVGREAYVRETLLTIFGTSDQIEPTKEDIETNRIVAFPDGVFRDWVVKFPDDNVERGSKISVSLSSFGTTTLTRFGSDVTFNGQESMQIQGPGKIEITQINVDDAAPDKVYKVAFLGGASEINQVSPDEYVLASPGLTVDEREKLESLSNGGGTVERLSTIMSASLILSGAEQQLAFDPAQTSRAQGITVNAGGSFTVNVDGYYRGDLSLFVDKSGGAGVDLSIWIEVKPLATGVWGLASPGMSNPIVFNDGGQPVALSGSVDALAGDEFRIMVKENAGAATLRTETKVVTLGSISDYAASLTVHRVGPVTA